MGNFCTAGTALAPQRRDLPREPPLVIVPSVPFSEDTLDARSSALINLQQQAYEVSLQGKHLSSSVLNKRRKAANLVSSTVEKIKSFRENTSTLSRAPEMNEIASALEHCKRTALARSEAPLREFVGKLERLEKETEGILDFVSECVISPSVPSALVVKTNELERSGTKVVALLEGSRKVLAEIEEQRGQTALILEEMSKLLAELATLIKLEPLSDVEVYTSEVVEEAESFNDARVEVEVAAEAAVEEQFETIKEVEVAAEAKEPQQWLSGAYDEALEATESIAKSALAQLYAKHQNPVLKPFDQAAVYQIFCQILASKHAYDSLLETQPLDLDVFTVSYFHTEFQEAPIFSLVQFLSGLQELVLRQDAVGQFIARVLCVFTLQPYPRVVATQVPQLAQVVDRAVDVWEKVRWAFQPHETISTPPQVRLLTGGRLHLLDALNLLAGILSEFPEYAWRFVEKLRPPLVTESDFLHFLIVYRMRALGRDGISLFRQIAKEGVVRGEDLEGGLKDALDLRLSKPAIDGLFFMMKSPKDGTVHRIDFLRFLSLQTYLEHERSDRFIVSKFQVLQAYADVCTERRHDLLSSLHSALAAVQSADPLSRDQVAEVLRSLGEVRDLRTVLEDYSDHFQTLVEKLERFGVRLTQKPFFSK